MAATPSKTPRLAETRIAEPAGWFERINAGFLRRVLRTCFRTLIGPPFGSGSQRLIVGLLARLMPGRGGTSRSLTETGGVKTEVVSPKSGESGGVILYIHGGAFCLGGAATHRGVTTHLAVNSGMPVWVPEYRLAPEHPYPAALDDVLSAYHGLINQGYNPNKIVIAGDSAGGMLALAIAIRLRDRGQAAPAGLMLISPVTDTKLQGSSLLAERGKDPMIRQGWLEQGVRWYNCPPEALEHRPLEVDLSGLPPMLIQVGDQEILLSNSTRLAEHAKHCGVACQLEIHTSRWHVFHLQSFYLRSAVKALQTLGAFARSRVAGEGAKTVADPVKRVGPAA